MSRRRERGTRRYAMTWLAAVTFALAMPLQAKEDAGTLKEAYANAFLVGVAVNDDIVAGRDTRSQALVPMHFNAITAENVMKNEVIHPRPGAYDFAAADAFVDFGEQHGMFIVGHTLVWHN